MSLSTPVFRLLARSVEIIGPDGRRETLRMAVLSFRAVEKTTLPRLYGSLRIGETVRIANVGIEPFAGERPALLLAESPLVLDMTSNPNLLKMP